MYFRNSSAVKSPHVLWNFINVIIRPIITVGGRLIKKDGDWERLTNFLNELRIVL
jgi:hypothetical protein